ncbi:unnamed protein product [Pleuronectes platessa]|uniref:Uncharacterized protein n=1 Tax=Pleuronectes platessa TaxID=8262 RepID=A0A9N7YIQ1_PLEPL|nr:unnamed protein product [Pleuronectes platessa]
MSLLGWERAEGEERHAGPGEAGMNGENQRQEEGRRRAGCRVRPEDRTEKLQKRTELVTVLLTRYSHRNKTPLEDHRSAPDLNAWRLKSPLALRSNSAMQTRPACARCRCTGEMLVHTDTHPPTRARSHTLLRLRVKAQSLTLAGACISHAASSALFSGYRSLRASVLILRLSSTACASASVSPQLDSRQAGNIHANLSILWRSIPGPVEAGREGDRRRGKVHGGVRVLEWKRKKTPFSRDSVPPVPLVLGGCTVESGGMVESGRGEGAGWDWGAVCVSSALERNKRTHGASSRAGCGVSQIVVVREYPARSSFHRSSDVQQLLGRFPPPCTKCLETEGRMLCVSSLSRVL